MATCSSCSGTSVQELVDDFACALLVALHLGEAGPVGGLVVRQFAGRRIDAEGEQAIELLVERRDVQRVTRDQIPVEGVDVPQVEDDAMAFADGALIKRRRACTRRNRASICSRACCSARPDSSWVRITALPVYRSLSGVRCEISLTWMRGCGAERCSG